MSKPMIVFDMDGVLVEVKESYRESIRATVLHFTGKDVPHDLIQHYKNQGGWNNDWKLSHELCSVYGKEVAYETVVETFNRYFFGVDGTPGLIEREKWIDTTGVLKRLNQRYDFAIFTGRLNAEAQITLRRFAGDLNITAVIGDDNVTQSKPHPEGLLKLMEQHQVVYYLGDTVDDAKASKAAHVPFIAITAPGGNFAAFSPAHFLTSINELETVL
ncbi:MAG: HAD-IA family hydrolase [Acidobacteria bacterium]|nr:HAD-IA family hydrolase [Acidobacteriota bacterium]